MAAGLVNTNPSIGGGCWAGKRVTSSAPSPPTPTRGGWPRVSRWSTAPSWWTEDCKCDSRCITFTAELNPVTHRVSKGAAGAKGRGRKLTDC
eukprot:1192775-Prorocentrum_minimum.AAC.2